MDPLIMNQLTTVLATVIGSLLASSGFWVFVQKKGNAKSAQSKLLLGLACDRIIDLGMKHLSRGMITLDELENIDKYLFEPYSEMGGNGLAERIMNDVRKLPICQGVVLTEIERKTLVQSECVPRPSGVPTAAAQ